MTRKCYGLWQVWAKVEGLSRNYVSRWKRCLHGMLRDLEIERHESRSVFPFTHSILIKK